MSKIVRFAALCASFGAAIPVDGQMPFVHNQGSIVDVWELSDTNDIVTGAARFSNGPAIVSADQLRHPISTKARRVLERAQRKGDLGNHSDAIEDLRSALIKYPESAPYTYTLIGREYIGSGDYLKAREFFGEAARLMPHESAFHSNLGLSLAILGQWDRAQQEVRKAIELDRANEKAKQILEAMRAAQSEPREPR